MELPTHLKENISAMVDKELPACEVELTLAALSEQEGRDTWRLYQWAGDVLRAQQSSIELSAGFSARLAERLAAEELPGQPANAASAATSATSIASITSATSAASTTSATSATSAMSETSATSVNPAACDGSSAAPGLTVTLP